MSLHQFGSGPYSHLGNMRSVFKRIFVMFVFAEACGGGEELQADGECRPCEEGTYRRGPEDGPSCVECPYGWTTNSTGATSVNDCTRGKRTPLSIQFISFHFNSVQFNSNTPTNIMSSIMAFHMYVVITRFCVVKLFLFHHLTQK